MAHLWQAHFGKPSRSGYHNQEWAAKMIEIGLIPSDTGAPGGKQTGPSMSDYVAPDGKFAAHTAALIASGFAITWQATPASRKPAKPPAEPEAPEPDGDEDADDDQTTPNPKNKIKYSCVTCGQNAWAKPNARLNCGDCAKPMIPQV